MSKRRLFLGNVPHDEDPISIEDIDYYDICEQSSKDFIRLIRQNLGKEPAGVRLKLHRSENDMGQETIQVVCVYNDDGSDKALDFVERLEEDCPRMWGTTFTDEE